MPEHSVVKTTMKPVFEKTFSVGRFVFYPNVLIGEFNEGVHVTEENVAEPVGLVREIYDDDIPIVYISNRLHSYSMDPTSYKELTNMFPNFKGFAVVSEDRYRRMIAKLEKLFVKKPIGVFCDLNDALEWAETILNKPCNTQ